MRKNNSAKTKKADPRHNIKLLLSSWQLIKRHCTDAIVSYKEVFDDDDFYKLEILINNSYSDIDMYAKSITESKQRTEILMAHVVHMIKVWESKCGGTYGGRLRRRIIRGFYFGRPRKSLIEIAKEEDKPYKLIVSFYLEALDQLSILIFGKDGSEKIDRATYENTLG